MSKYHSLLCQNASSTILNYVFSFFYLLNCNLLLIVYIFTNLFLTLECISSYLDSRLVCSIMLETIGILWMMYNNPLSDPHPYLNKSSFICQHEV